MLSPERMTSFLGSLQNQGRMLTISADKPDLFMRKNFFLDSPTCRSEVFDKTSSFFPSLTKKQTTFRGVTITPGISKIRAFKFSRVMENDEESILINMALRPCREYCVLCLHGETYCTNVFSYKHSISKKDFEKTVTTEQRRLSPQ